MGMLPTPRSVLLPTLSAASLNSEALMVVTDGQVGKQDFPLMPFSCGNIFPNAESQRVL